jgi:hypothetical protein
MIQEILIEEETLENDAEIFHCFYHDPSVDLLCRRKQDRKER